MGYICQVECDSVLLKDEYKDKVDEINELLEEKAFGDKERISFDTGSFTKEQIHSSKTKKEYFFRFTEPSINNFIIEDAGEVLAPYVKGGTIYSKGEEGEVVRLIFDGKGNYKTELGEVYFGELIDEFLRFYNKELTDELKQKLEKWRITRKI